MGGITEGGTYADPEGGLFIGRPFVKGIHTGNIKTVTPQSKAGLGTQGPIQTHSYPEALPAPKDMDLPD